MRPSFAHWRLVRGNTSQWRKYTIAHGSRPPISELPRCTRTLQLLTDIGFLTRDYLGDNNVRYEISHEEEPHGHHHLVCLSCGAILETEADLMEAIEDMLQQKYGFEIVNHRIQFMGYCAKCIKARTSGGAKA